MNATSRTEVDNTKLGKVARADWELGIRLDRLDCLTYANWITNERLEKSVIQRSYFDREQEMMDAFHHSLLTQDAVLLELRIRCESRLQNVFCLTGEPPSVSFWSTKHRNVT